MEKINGYQISYTDKDLLVDNKECPQLYLEVINTSKNYGAYNWFVNKGFSQIFSNKPNKINLGLPEGENSNYYFDRIHITDKKTFFDIFVIKEDKELIRLTPSNYNLDIPLTIITGHSGGGTSIIAKSLKYLGIHIGEDCGDFSNRKAFESISFRTYLFHTYPFIEESYITPTLNSILSSYQYRDNEPNIVKITDLEHNQTSLKLSKYFSNIKFLSIIKNKSSQTYSLEGERFNQQNELDIFRQQHPTIEGAPIFHLDWEKYFTDYNYVNKVLKYIGSDTVLNKDTFNLMLKEISFDNSRLS